MNNSKLIVENVSLQIEEKIDNKPRFREREAQLVRLINAIQAVYQSKEWSSLKTELFDNLASNLEQRLMVEARKESPDPTKLSRLSGELKWAERYANLQKLEQEFKTELSQIKQQLYGTSEETG